MRELHVLGVSEDGSSLLLATSKNAAKPTHRVPLDDKVKAAAAGRLNPYGAQRADPALSPKEMQARMREGATVEEVAEAAGVPAARVLPYFAPVEAERDRIVEQARLAPMSRTRGPVSTRPLGLLVDARLLDITGIKPESISWSARRRRDGTWVVSVSYYARGQRQAEWLWSPTARELVPVDPTAARLGADVIVSTKRKAASKPRPKAAPARSAPVKKAAPRKVARKAQPAVAAKTPKTSARKLAPKPIEPIKVVKPVKAVKPRRPRVVAAPEVEPVVEPEVAAAPVFEPGVIPLPVTPIVAAAPEPAAEPEPEQVVEAEPAQPDAIEADAIESGAPTEQVAEKPARKPGQRVPLPSWDDVLLGVSKQHGGQRRSG